MKSAKCSIFRGVSGRSRRGVAVCWRQVSGRGRSADAASGAKQPAFERPALYANRRDNCSALSDGRSLVQVIVENPGTPIAPEHLPRLFDRFYRVDPSRQRKGEGSGIGTAIVKSIVVAHKGTVAVTSDARGQGLLSHYPLNPSANGNFYNQCKNNVPQ